MNIIKESLIQAWYTMRPIKPLVDKYALVYLKDQLTFAPHQYTERDGVIIGAFGLRYNMETGRLTIPRTVPWPTEGTGLTPYHFYGEHQVTMLGRISLMITLCVWQQHHDALPN